jgi:16S rRNA processing protein RimM
LVAADELITVGALGRTRGVHGDMYVIPTSDDPERFVGLKEIFVSSRDTWVKMNIASVQVISGRAVMRFEGIGNPEDAAQLTNRRLALPRHQLIELPENTFFVFDLEGCSVYDERTGELVGTVSEVETYPANDVYVIETTDGAELLCPVTAQFVKRVDVENNKIVIVRDGLAQIE